MNMGVVFEIKNKTALVMKNDGTYVNVPADPKWQKGDVVRLRRAVYRLPHAANFAAACLVLFIGVYLWSFLIPMGYVELSINPKVEITVNRYSRIIGSAGLNQDGVDLLSQLPLWGKSVDKGYELLLAKINEKGYFAEGKTLSVSVSAPTQEKADGIESQIACTIDEQLKRMNVNCPVYMHKYPIEKYQSKPDAEIPMFIECAGERNGQIFLCLSKPLDGAENTEFKVLSKDGTSLALTVANVNENYITLNTDGLVRGEPYTVYVGNLRTTVIGGRYMECAAYSAAGHNI